MACIGDDYQLAVRENIEIFFRKAPFLIVTLAFYDQNGVGSRAEFWARVLCFA